MTLALTRVSRQDGIPCGLSPHAAVRCGRGALLLRFLGIRELREMEMTPRPALRFLPGSISNCGPCWKRMARDVLLSDGRLHTHTHPPRSKHKLKSVIIKADLKEIVSFYYEHKANFSLCFLPSTHRATLVAVQTKFSKLRDLLTSGCPCRPRGVPAL